MSPTEIFSTCPCRASPTIGLAVGPRPLGSRAARADGPFLGDVATGLEGIVVLEALAVNSEGRLLAALPPRVAAAPAIRAPPYFRPWELIPWMPPPPNTRISRPVPPGGRYRKPGLSIHGRGMPYRWWPGPLRMWWDGSPCPPGPLAVRGGTLFVVSRGELATHPAESFSQDATDVQLIPAVPSGSNLHLTPRPALSRLSRPITPYITTGRFLMDPLEENSFTGGKPPFITDLDPPARSGGLRTPTEQYRTLNSR